MVRADVNRVVIGARTNIQDGSVVHCDSPKPRHPEGFPTIIGKDGVEGYLDVDLSAEEKDGVANAAKVLKETYSQIA